MNYLDKIDPDWYNDPTGLISRRYSPHYCEASLQRYSRMNGETAYYNHQLEDLWALQRQIDSDGCLSPIDTCGKPACSPRPPSFDNGELEYARIRRIQTIWDF